MHNAISVLQVAPYVECVLNVSQTYLHKRGLHMTQIVGLIL